MRALFQVRATEHDKSECVLDIKVDQIKRWAAQPLPVFLVGVGTTTGKLFAKSIDEIVVEDLAGKDPFEITTKTVRVRLKATEDLGATVRASIHNHYAAARLDLATMGDSEIKSHYFEVLSRRNPDDGASIPTSIWTVLWKSPPRPQHFAAMVTELKKRARRQYEHVEPRPMLFFFNIFCSAEDRHYDLAAARVDVINADHPRAEELRTVLQIADGYRVRLDRDLPESREYFQSIAVPPEEFREYAKKVGQALDTLTGKVLKRAKNARRAWDDALNAEFTVVNDLWNNQTVGPSECRMLEASLDEYFQCLLRHNVIERNRAQRFPAAERVRLLEELETQLEQCRGSWSVVLRTER